MMVREMATMPLTGDVTRAMDDHARVTGLAEENPGEPGFHALKQSATWVLTQVAQASPERAADSLARIRREAEDRAANLEGARQC